MQVAIIFAVVAYAMAVPVPDECAWGQSYWCRDLVTAKGCRAIQHCLSAVWTKQIIAKGLDSSDECLYCETIVQKVRSLLDTNANEADIQRALEKGCSMFPAQIAVTKCRAIINNDLPELLTIISAKLDPAMVCSLVGVCKAFGDRVQHSPISPPQQIKSRLILQSPIGPLGTLCEDCEKLIGDVKELISGKQTEKKVIDFINLNFCAYLGALQDESDSLNCHDHQWCKQVTSNYLKGLFAMIQKDIKPACICKSIGFCSKNGTCVSMLAKMRLQGSPLDLARSMAKSGEACLLCKMVLTELQSLERDPAAQKTTMAFLKKEICSQLGTLQAACEATIDQYGPELLELLVNELDPVVRCKSFGLCAAAPALVPVPVKVALHRLLPGRMTAPLEAVLRRGIVLPAATVKMEKTITLQASEQCVLCEFVIKEVASMLKTNSSQKEIMSALEKVCSILPSTVRADCKSFVDEYGPAVIALLEQELDPKVVCSQLGLCRAGRNVQRYVALVKSPEVCVMCQTVMQYINSLLAENSTVQEIVNAVDKVCNFIPGSYKAECDNLIKTYGPTIIMLLQQLSDPKEICVYLSLCDGKTKKPMMLIAAAPEALVVVKKVELLGQNKCTWGPAFWCDTLENAKRCNAVKHCTDHVWSRNKGQ